MNNIPYIDILILAMIAVFIINRLRNTLGKKTGNEHDLTEKYSNKTNFKESSPDKIVKNKIDAESSGTQHKIFHEDALVAEQLNKIRAIDSGFTIDSFIDGAKKAFEFIIKKYSDENLPPLKKLLSGNIFKMFDS